MAQQQQQQQQGAASDSAYGPIWAIVGLFLVCFFAWKMFRAELVTAFFYVDLLQAKVISLFTNKLDNDIHIMQTIDPSVVTFNQVISVSTRIGMYMRYPCAVVLIGLAFRMYLSNITLKYRREHSMSSLRTQEQANWKQIIPVLKENLVEEDITKGPWAMASTPMEFAKRHKLLRKDDFAPEDPLRPGVPITAGVRKGSTKSVFVIQLGHPWRGFDLLPPHYLALAAIFAAKINRDRDSVTQLMDEINQSFGRGKISFQGSKVLMKKYAESKEVQDICAKHAYEITVMASLLESARNDGVLPTADFLWLKTYDRRLWYVLNSVGRETAFVEVAGAYAHWKAEKALERRSMVPMVDEAVKALEEGIKEVKLPRPELAALER